MKLRPLVRILGRIVGIPRGNYLDPSSLGSGTPSSSNVLNGDSQWVTPGSMGYVPYTGATQDVDLGEYGIDTGYVTFDDTPTGTPTSQGTMSWDVDRQSVKLVMNGTTGHVMQDTFYYVKNQSGSTIPKGTVVMANGTLGASGRILVVPFLADGTYPSKFCMGVTSENIPNGGDGMVMDFGQIKGINTSMYSDGDILYASSTVAGGFTDVRPNAPNNIVTVAIVIHAASNGVIQVRPTFSSNINDDEGVVISTPSDGDVLTYELSSGLWKNSASVNLGSSDLTSSANTRTFTLNGTTSSNKLEISNGTNAVLHIAGNNTVWCRGAGNVSTNTAFGESAGRSNTTGGDNSFFGQNCGERNTIGSSNTFFGRQAGAFNTLGGNNTFIGRNAGLSHTTGLDNTFVGRSSAESITTSSGSTFIGRGAGRFIADGVTALTTATESVLIGKDTKANGNSETNQIVIGYNATGNGSNTTTIGNSSITKAYISGDWYSDVNTKSIVLNGATSSNKLEISNGTNAVLHIAGNNTVWARGAGNVTTNASFGEQALDANTSGSQNTAFGYRALTSMTTASGSTAVGRSALNSSTGRSNTAVGDAALTHITTTVDNIAIGQNAGRYISDGVTSNTIGVRSVFLGSQTKPLTNGDDNAIVIGYNAIGNGSNTATIGNSSIVATYLGGQVKVGSFASAPTGIEGAIYYDSVTKKHYGFDGTAWNAFY